MRHLAYEPVCKLPITGLAKAAYNVGVMHWPDYRSRKKQNSSGRSLAVLLTLAISVLMAGELNGWWQLTPLPGGRQTETAASTVMATPASSVAITATGVPPALTGTPLPMVSVATEAPDFSLPDLYDSTRSRSLSDYAGKPVILNFWASWCAPCRDEMPALERAFQQYQEQGLVVLGINQLYIDDLEAAQAFVTELQLTFSNVADETGQVSERRYRVIGLPTSVFITPEGEIAHVQIGQMTDRQIDDYSQRLIAGDEIVP